MTDVSHGRELRLPALSLPLPVDDNPWFWNPVDASGLRPLLLSGYESISHGLVCAVAREMASGDQQLPSACWGDDHHTG